MSANTIATIEATLRAVLTAPEGDQVITFSQGAIDQMNEVTDIIITATGYDETKVTEDDLFLAASFASYFTKAAVSGVVVDGVIQPAKEEEFRAELERVKEVYSLGAGMFGVALPVVLLCKIFNELPSFTR
jgi:hypothetical protein